MVNSKIYQNFSKSVRDCTEIKQKASRRSKKRNKNEKPSKSLKEKIIEAASDLGGKIAAFAHKTKMVILGVGKSSWNIMKKGVNYAIDGSNRYMDSKRAYFEKLFGKKLRKTRSLRWSTGIVLVVTGPYTGFIGVVPGLVLLALDP